METVLIVNVIAIILLILGSYLTLESKCSYIFVVLASLLTLTAVAIIITQDLDFMEDYYPSIEEAPYKVGTYYADSYVIKEGCIILDDYFIGDVYKNHELVILEGNIPIVDRRDNG